MSAGARLLVVAGLSAIAVVYVSRLDAVPPAMGGDEVDFGNHALAIARSGHDLNGRRLPLFIQVSEPLTPNLASAYWYQPFLFYVIAAALTVLPFSEWSVRLPVALLGLLNMGLTYFVAVRLWRDRRYAVLAMMMLGLTPAHMVMSRQALDYLCPVTFVLAWLWCTLSYLDGHRARAIAMGAVLGVGTFSYVAAWMLMPVLLMMSAWITWSRGGFRDVVRLAGAFAMPVLAAGAWLAFHPDPITQTLHRYGGRYPGSRISLYWDYFDPSFLFVAGGTDPTQTTSGAGVFLLPLALLLPVGLVTALRRRTVTDALLVAGFLLAPLPVVLALPPNPEYSVARAMLLVPFGVLLAIIGAKGMIDRGGWTRIASLMLIAALPLQFLAFTRDYFGEYGQRAVIRFDPGGNQELARRLLAHVDRESTPVVYLDGDTSRRARRWLFFLNTRGRPDVWLRTRYYDATGVDPVPAGSLVVFERADGPAIMRRSSAGTWITP